MSKSSRDPIPKRHNSPVPETYSAIDEDPLPAPEIYCVTDEDYLALKKVTQLPRLRKQDIQIISVESGSFMTLTVKDIALFETAKKQIEGFDCLNAVTTTIPLGNQENYFLSITFGSDQPISSFFEAVKQKSKTEKLTLPIYIPPDLICQLSTMIDSLNAELKEDKAHSNLKIKKKKLAVLTHLKTITDQHNRKDILANAEKRADLAQQAIQACPGSQDCIFQGGWKKQVIGFASINLTKDFFTQWCGGAKQFDKLMEKIKPPSTTTTFSPTIHYV